MMCMLHKIGEEDIGQVMFCEMFIYSKKVA